MSEGRAGTAELYVAAKPATDLWFRFGASSWGCSQPFPHTFGLKVIMQQWYVMYTKPNKEVLVNQLLEAKGIETYFPFFQVNRGYSRGIRVEALFPHYLFFRADLQTNEGNGLRTLPGLRTIVQCENEPVAVPDAVIALLRKRLDVKTDKVYDRSRWFHPGQELVVDGGPFDGLEAIFRQGLTGRDRAQVMLRLLSTWTKAEIAYEHLRPRNQAATLGP